MRWWTATFGSLCMLVLVGVIAIHSGTAGSDGCGPEQRMESAASPPGVNNTISFQKLNTTQQAAFHDALACNAKFGPESKWLNVSRGYSYQFQDQFEEYEYIRYDGGLYEIIFSRGEFIASYTISTSVVTPPEEEPVTAFEDLPSSIRGEMKEALTTGSYHAPPGKWGTLPEPIPNVEYIRYGNQTYEISATVSDGRLDVMSLERVDEKKGTERLGESSNLP